MAAITRILKRKMIDFENRIKRVIGSGNVVKEHAILVLKQSPPQCT